MTDPEKFSPAVYQELINQMAVRHNLNEHALGAVLYSFGQYSLGYPLARRPDGQMHHAVRQMKPAERAILELMAKEGESDQLILDVLAFARQVSNHRESSDNRSLQNFMKADPQAQIAGARSMIREVLRHSQSPGR